jgi:hypothetical protein
MPEDPDPHIQDALTALKQGLGLDDFSDAVFTTAVLTELYRRAWHAAYAEGFRDAGRTYGS